MLVLAACSTTAPTHVAHPLPAAILYAAYGQPVPDGPATVAAVSCGTGRDCAAVGTASGDGAVYATTDAAATWERRTTLAAGSSLDGVSCTGPRFCMAVGQSGSVGAVVTTADGWKRTIATTTPPGTPLAVTAVDCQAVDTCTVLATNGATFWSATTADGGSTWTAGGSLPAGFGGATDLSCRAGTCVVAGFTSTTPGHGAGAVAVSTDGGGRWAAAAVPAGTGLLHAASCSADLDCMAVGTSSTVTSGVPPGAGAVLTSQDGTTFSAVRPPASLGDGFGVSCWTAGGCAAVGTQWTHAIPATPLVGIVTTFDLGADFRAPAAFYIPGTLVAVSCPTARLCVAGGDNVLARFALPPGTGSQPRRAATSSPGSRRGAGSAS